MKSKIILLAIGLVFIFTSCQQNTTSTETVTKTVTETVKTKKGMIKVTILYQNGDGKTFDMDYYSNKHMPMIADLLGESLKSFEIDKGISGRTPDEAIPYLAIGYLYFDQLSDYQNSFGPHAKQIVGDIPNYTNIQPILQISEVVQ